MATEAQYAFFKSMHEEENERYKQLAARAKLYFTIQTAYLAAIAFKFEDIKTLAQAFSVPLFLFVAIGLFLVLGLLFTILATRIRDYEAPADLNEIIDSFGPHAPTDAAFLDARLVDLAVATERNSASNDKAAAWLTVTGWVLFTAIAVHFVTLLWAYLVQLRQ